MARGVCLRVPSLMFAGLKKFQETKKRGILGGFKDYGGSKRRYQPDIKTSPCNFLMPDIEQLSSYLVTDRIPRPRGASCHQKQGAQPYPERDLLKN
jgi:hypothetical protein